MLTHSVYELRKEKHQEYPHRCHDNCRKDRGYGAALSIATTKSRASATSVAQTEIDLLFQNLSRVIPPSAFRGQRPDEMYCGTVSMSVHTTKWPLTRSVQTRMEHEVSASAVRHGKKIDRWLRRFIHELARNGMEQMSFFHHGTILPKSWIE